MTFLRKTLSDLYPDAFDVIETAVRACPDDLWGGSVWRVSLDDRHVWPIVRGLGGELPDAERVQLHSAFWRVAYHVLYWCDHYLGGGLGRPSPPAPFSEEDERPHSLPARIYTREELLAYLDHCRRKADAVLGALTDEEAERPARIGQPYGEVLIRNLIQLTDHAAQLNLFLNRGAQWSDPRWTPADRWYRRCPDCA